MVVQKLDILGVLALDDDLSGSWPSFVALKDVLADSRGKARTFLFHVRMRMPRCRLPRILRVAVSVLLHA